MLTYVVAFFLSMIVAAICTPLVTRWAHANHWFDLPSEARKVHTQPIPRIGGLAVVTAFFTPIFGLALYTNRISGLLYADATLVSALCLGAAAIVLLGVYDDLKGADAKLKLIVQTIVAVGMWVAGFRIELLGNPFGPAFQLGVFSLPLTVLWIVGIVNALNLIDGLDGLASGMALFAAVVLFGVSFVDHAVLLCLLTACLGGALIGFLFFNFNPAKIFLGDSGSMFLGFILAVMSIWTQRKGATMVALLIPVIALGVPILDTTLSFLRRLARRQNPFKADREHLHHRLLGLGLSHRNAVFTLYTVSAVFALGALALLDNDTTHRAIVLATVAMVVFILVRKIGGLKGHGLTQQSEDNFRDGLRAAARQIRDASHAEQAWGALVGFVPHLRCDELRLSLRTEAEPQKDELRETVFRWRRNEERAWRLDGSKPLAHLSRLPLEDNGVSFGELLVLATNQSTLEQQVALQLLREAVIDFAVRRRAETKPTDELASNVVRLAKS